MNLLGLKLLVFLWQALLILPLSFQKIIGQLIGLILKLSNLKRIRYGKINIENCLKGHDTKKIFNRNLKNFGYAIFETGFAWFWSDKKINKNINYEIKGIESLVNEQKNNNGVLLFFKHSLHLELDARLLGMNSEVYGVERVHNSDLFDSIQKKGRLKSVKDTCDKNNPIKFIRWLKKGKTVLYATDQDYGLNQSDVINFFSQPAATISAPSKIINTTGCKTYFMNTYIDSGKYILDIEELNLYHLNGSNFSQSLNDFMEKKIRNNPDEYLWQHRRFKSTLGKEDFYA